MLDEAALFSRMRDWLSERIVDLEAEVRSTVDKEYRRYLREMIADMRPDDELWRWKTSGWHGPRRYYSEGWCIVRGGEVVAERCYAWT